MPSWRQSSWQRGWLWSHQGARGEGRRCPRVHPPSTLRPREDLHFGDISPGLWVPADRQGWGQEGDGDKFLCTSQPSRAASARHPPCSSLQAALIPPSLWQSPNESDARITHAWRQPHSSQSHCCRSTPATSSLSGGTWGHHPISVTPSQPQCVLGSSKISAMTPALHCETGIKPQPSWEHKAGSSGSPPSPTFLEPCPTRSVAGPPRTARVPSTRHIASSLRHWRLLALAASLIPGTGSIAAL